MILTYSPRKGLEGFSPDMWGPAPGPSGPERSAAPQSLTRRPRPEQWRGMRPRNCLKSNLKNYLNAGE